MLWQALPTLFDDEALALNWREHSPVCNNTSSLSFCTHALLALALAILETSKNSLILPRVLISMTAPATPKTVPMVPVKAGFGWPRSRLWRLRIGHDKVAIEPTCPTLGKLRYRATVAGCSLTVNVTRTGHRRQCRDQSRILPWRANVTIAGGDEVTKEYRKDWVENELEGVAFDLVLVTTDAYHYRAWEELADDIGLHFDESINHRLRGVSRQENLRRIYEANDKALPDADTEASARKRTRCIKSLSEKSANRIFCPVPLSF